VSNVRGNALAKLVTSKRDGDQATRVFELRAGADGRSA
jgi:hypothetical protein